MIRLKAYAKLNLSLDIRGRRPDGYHELDTIMQSIDLFDAVLVKKADTIRAGFDAPDLDPLRNTAVSAAKEFFAFTGIPGGADISVQKRIPVQSGMGGASADAAAVLIGLNRLYEAQLDVYTLRVLAKRVGADVPFALTGGTARARGIGEALTPLHPRNAFCYLVVQPHEGVSTAEAFARYRVSEHVSIDTVEYALVKGDMDLFLRCAGNALGLAALAIAPSILRTANALRAAGAKKALMTGSGSAMFAPFKTTEEARSVAERIKGDFAYCGVHSPVSQGLEIMEETQ